MNFVERTTFSQTTTKKTTEKRTTKKTTEKTTTKTTKQIESHFFETVLGRWKQVSSVNLVRFLEVEGGNLVYQMAAGRLKPNLEISKIGQR